MGKKTPEGRLLDIIKKAQDRFKLKKELKVFTKVNIILICVIITILVIVLVDVVTSSRNVPELSVEVPQEAVAVKVDLDKDVDEDIEIVMEERDFPVPREGITKDLNLLGIITGDTDQAIIENSQTKKTFFLYKGDRFLGFTVYEIKDSRVILDYKGERIELKM